MVLRSFFLFVFFSVLFVLVFSKENFNNVSDLDFNFIRFKIIRVFFDNRCVFFSMVGDFVFGELFFIVKLA